MAKVCGLSWADLIKKPIETANKIDRNMNYKEALKINQLHKNAEIAPILKPEKKLCALMKVIGQNEIKKIFEVTVTSYYLIGQLEALKNLQKQAGDDEKYIICVGYKNSSGSFVDMQPGLTETCKLDELPEECACRGLCEECNGFMIIEDLEKLSQPIMCPTKTIYHFSVELSKVSMIIDYIDDTRGDDNARKVCVFPWGNKSKVKSFMKFATVMDSHEQIGYYVAIPIDHAVKILELIKINYVCHKAKTFKYTL